jgi:hypothetical protein
VLLEGKVEKVGSRLVEAPTCRPFAGALSRDGCRAAREDDV